MTRALGHDSGGTASESRKARNERTYFKSSKIAIEFESNGCRLVITYCAGKFEVACLEKSSDELIASLPGFPHTRREPGSSTAGTKVAVEQHERHAELLRNDRLTIGRLTSGRALRVRQSIMRRKDEVRRYLGRDAHWLEALEAIHVKSASLSRAKTHLAGTTLRDSASIQYILLSYPGI